VLVNFLYGYVLYLAAIFFFLVDNFWPIFFTFYIITKSFFIYQNSPCKKFSCKSYTVLCYHFDNDKIFCFCSHKLLYHRCTTFVFGNFFHQKVSPLNFFSHLQHNLFLCNKILSLVSVNFFYGQVLYARAEVFLAFSAP